MSSNVERWERKYALHPVVAIVITVVITAAGVTLVGSFISIVHSAMASKHWSRTEGVITDSRWQPHKGQDGSAIVTYTYSVDGRTYEGKDLLAGGGRYFAEEEKAKVKQYRLGMTVPVFYDPQDPNCSCIESGYWSWVSVGPLAMGLLFLLIASWHAWRLVNKKPILGRPVEPAPAVEEYDFLPKK